MFGLGCLKMCRLLWLAAAECGAVVSIVGWASAHRPACRCFTVVAACCCFGGLKPTLLCLRLLPHRCRLNHLNRFFLFVLSIRRHIFRFPHAVAECGAVAARRRVGFSPPPRLPLFYCCCSLLLFRWAEAHPTERQAAVRGNIRIVCGAGRFRTAGLR
ncbi:Uncharacterised protein [Neisseria meningitidis]|nr:Uncharacterised protein [Neisseria meningitidis]CWM76012.1 Uncharacterised protein [Neisseria meningitidis]CWM93585.1 Uncharacterised protein [Neisseria meningitidis]CWN48922.1 Uncharacterised protein [Neisseria meningitidis]CWN53279.1 Uncharacterised protein [Neisseria meningitidis]